MLHELMSALGKKINNVEVEVWGEIPYIYGISQIIPSQAKNK